MRRAARGGRRPAGDAVTDPKAVAAPTFGRRFSDPAAHAAAGRPSQENTHKLFGACPAS